MVLIATQVKRRRGTTAENDAFTGAEGEITVDLTKKTLRVHDGSTQGGTELARMSDIGSGIDKAISNCITEIPQNIKLELNNGTLTLKAGSKVYVPNGAGIFYEKTTTQDITISVSGSQTVMVCVRADIANGVDVIEDSRTYSGSTNPGQTYSFWYDTTNNLVKLFIDNTSTPARTESLPIAIITSTNGTVTSIDQVFNGFGYIGSTVFALPGVKGLIPNGRNPDGSLKNTTTNDFTIVKTVQVNTSVAKIAMYSGGGLGSQTKNFELNEPENYNYDTGVLTNALEVARVIVDSNAKITAFTPKTAFHALDYNDKGTIVGWTIPDYTAGISRSSDVEYTAESNGFLCLIIGSQSYTSYLYLNGVSIKVSDATVVGTFYHTALFPIAKGDVYRFRKFNNTSTITFTFYPCRTI